MRIAQNEKELYDYTFVVAAHFQLAHFCGFYPLLFDRLDDLNLICYEKKLSDEFLDKYTGHIIFLTKQNTDSLMRRNRNYKTVMIDHGPLPVGSRSCQRFYSDYLIVSGSDELCKRVDLGLVGKTILDGYFPTDYFLPEREEKKVLVQVTEESKSAFKAAEASRVLLQQGFQVNVYDHVLFKTDLSGLPSEAHRVNPGLEYVQALSSCSHFVFCGTSGCITCMYTQGCRLICLSEKWAKQNNPLFSEVLMQSCYLASNEQELIQALDKPSRYDRHLTEYLYGTDRSSVIEKIRKTLLAIANGQI